MIKQLATIVIILCSFSSQAQLTEGLAKEQIKLVMKFQESSWNSGNIPQYMEGYWKSDSLLFIGSKGPTYGWTKTLTNYLKSYPTSEAMGELQFDLIRIDLLSEQDAFVTGKWQLNRAKDTLQGHYSLLWKKINNEWKIIVDHSSSSD